MELEVLAGRHVAEAARVVARHGRQRPQLLAVQDPLRDLHADHLDVDELLRLWVSFMTSLTMDDIANAHQRIVASADARGVSVSSRSLGGIL